MNLKLFTTLALCAALTFSCTEDKFSENQPSTSEVVVYQTDDGTVALRDGLLDFSTFEAFDSFTKRLLNDNSFREEITKKFGKDLLIGQVNNGTISQKNQAVLDKTPVEYAYILNKDAAYVMEGEYNRFGSTEQFMLPVADKDKFDWSNEAEIDLSKVRTFKYGKQVISSLSNPNARHDFGNSQDAVGGGQKEFWLIAPMYGNRKWVDQVESISAQNGTVQGPGNNWYPRYKQQVVFKVDLYWRGSANWKLAGEDREIIPNFNWVLKYGPDPNTAPIRSSGSTNTSCCVTTNPPPTPVYTNGQWYQIMNDSFYNDFSLSYNQNKWYLTGSGSVSHRVLWDGAANTWNRSWAW